jgi:glycosyltransferase involved in cell wall biosynthesis
MSRLYRRSPEYLRVLRDAAEGAHAVIASHPYTFPAIREVTSGPVWYEAHNVEAILKADVLSSGDCARGLLADVEEVERACCREAELVWACSVEDRDELISRYGAPADHVVVVPNGVALEHFSYASSSVRRDRKRSLGMDGRFLALFIGSWHQPNVVGVGNLLQIAAVHRTTEFVIVGSINMALAGRRVPSNVDLTGVVSGEFKAAVLGIADVALNPVTSGSGTNIKMLDYFASGVPVISTRFGARGLGVRAGEHYLGVDLDQFAGALTMARETDLGALDALAQAARAHVERTLTWSAVAESLLAVLC